MVGQCQLPGVTKLIVSRQLSSSTHVRCGEAVIWSGNNMQWQSLVTQNDVN